MADIISGGSRFTGDKKAPVKKVIQLNTDNKEQTAVTDEADYEEVKLRIRRHRIRMGVLVLIVVALIVGAVLLAMHLLDGYTYSSYSITGSLNREDTASSQYIAYNGGYIKYSNDGASYYTDKGKAIWNQTYSMQKPQVKMCEDCVAIGDINGNTVYVFNKTGMLGKIDTSLVISQIEVASNGAVVAVLEDNEANYINMYSKEGTKIYSIKTTVSGDGYPLDVSISNDATKLIASYVYVSGEDIKTNVVFYNFSEVGQNETERVVGGFNHYNDTLVGDVQFLSNNIAVAVGEDDLGGITIDVREAELEMLNACITEQIGISGEYSDGVFSAGTQLLNGTQATGWARIRSTDQGDITRTERQRTVIAKMIQKAKSSDLSTINDIIDDVFPNIYTSLTKKELMSLAKDMFDYNLGDTIGFPMAYAPVTTDAKGAVLVPADLTTNVSALHEFLFGTQDYTPTSKVQGISSSLQSETGVGAQEIDLNIFNPPTE